MAPRAKMPFAEQQLAERILAGLAWRPRFGLLIGLGETDEEIEPARRTLASLRDQVHGHWRATILRRGRTVPALTAKRLTEGFDDLAGRIDIRLDAPAGASLAALAAGSPGGARPDLVGVLLAGDVLGCDALLEMAIASGLSPEAEFLYSDERRISPASERHETFFKPQWSAELLTATNYIGRFWCVLPSLLARTGATMRDWFQFGDYDVVLRCTEMTSGICHIPRVLCERGRSRLDHPDQERGALKRAMRRRGVAAEVVEAAVWGTYRVKRAAPVEAFVSIVIPTCGARDRVMTCLQTLRATTSHRNFEIICADNIPAAEADRKAWLRAQADTVVACDEPFNWSRFNNLAAREAKGEFLLFLNDDTEITEPGWLDALLEHAQRDGVGVVGARLLYPDRTVQHAGMFWTPRGGRHAFRGARETDPGYFGLALCERNVIAVTGACMLMRRSEFEALGGFDERHAIVNGDVDFCLRCWERGKAVVYTPHATLLHHESASRAELGDVYDSEAFARRWHRSLAAGDPFHHPSLSCDRDDLAPDAEPLELVYSSRPLLDRAAIRNILAVKLDHIGDFITAIPALQLLQRHFPQARLYLLCAPGAGELRELVPGLTGVIEFELFFARSGLGQKDLSADDFAALGQRLRPYGFDLAVDLRKAPETRPVLRHTGARWLAGFDHGNQFPWLDIVVHWEADRAGARKRSHVGDDLQKLVYAVATAGEPAPPARPTAMPHAAPPVAGGSSRKTVCIHPGVGSPIRQWPPDKFAALIDLLASEADVDIVLIGAAEEAEIGAQVIARAERADSIRSLIGKLSLRELVQFLSTAALYVGNNSGPKHLAARLGVPTVGVHSGTVDAREWGPLGANAVAVRKNMVCSPCYLSDPADCPRELACLTELQPSDVHAICRRLLAIDANR